MKALVALATIGLVAAASPAFGATNIAFTFTAPDADFVQPKAPGVITRQYSGSGNILFKSTLTNGVYGLADIAAFTLDLRIDALIVIPPNNLFADFRFGLADLDAFSITYNGGVPTAASFSTGQVVRYQSTPNFTPAPASLDFSSGAPKPLTINAFLTPGVKTPFARTTITTMITNTAVPEPASWMMMITGMGLAGAAMRARRTIRLKAA